MDDKSIEQLTIRVSSWKELHEILFADSWSPDLQRFRSSRAFRGMVNSAWDLQTSLMRLGGDYIRLEKPLLRSFRKYAHRDAAAETRSGTGFPSRNTMACLRACWIGRSLLTLHCTSRLRT